jgi:hypothetical protein
MVHLFGNLYLKTLQAEQDRLEKESKATDFWQSIAASLDLTAQQKTVREKKATGFGGYRINLNRIETFLTFVLVDTNQPLTANE